MSSAPSTPTVQGPPLHDASGRFVKGNPGGPGNPHNKQIAGLRQALLRTVTPDDIETIVRSLIDLAREGNLPAIKMFLAYFIGKPDAFVRESMAWAEDCDIGPLAAPEWSKVNVPAAPNLTPEQPKPSPTTAVVAERPGRIGNPSYSPNQAQAEVAAAAMIQPESAPPLNGGKRLTKQQRRALRRQAKGKPLTNGDNGSGAPSVNAGNGWALDSTPAQDPLAALARQRDLVK
jgi:hypothetical protein